MAKAKGIFKVQGKIGDLYFFIKNGEQHIQLTGTQKGKRMKTYDKNDKRIVTNNIRVGLNYYATSLHRLMKMSGVTIGKSQFNTLMNHIYYGMRDQLRGRPTILASEVKKVVHGFRWQNNHDGSILFAVQDTNGILIENTSATLLDGPRCKEEKYHINVYKITLEDLTWNGEKYNYTLPGKIPAFLHSEVTFNADSLCIQLEMDPPAENEFVVMSVLPTIDEHYFAQTGASVWVF